MTDMINLTVADRIATVTLDRPPVNAFNAAMFKAFHGILDGLATRTDWSVLHIRSAIKVFSGGADLAEISHALCRSRQDGGGGAKSRGRSRSCSSASPTCRR